jgi:methionyl aminopeptidase
MFRMVHYKNAEEIELMRQSALMVSRTHAEVAAVIRPGITTAAMDKLAETYIRDNGGVPAFKGYRGFPATLCISINDEVVHGIPGNREIKDGDVVSVDCGVCKDKYFGDAAYTYAIGDVQEDSLKLLRITEEALYKGIEKAMAGNRMGDIGFAIQEHTELKNGLGVVRDLIGHGIGRSLHESPDVPNYGRRGQGMLLKEGLVIAIEPMINLGTHKVKQLNDGWTIATADGKPSAHFEHTVAIMKGKADILSDHSIIEEAIKNNIEIKIFK